MGRIEVDRVLMIRGVRHEVLVIVMRDPHMEGPVVAAAIYGKVNGARHRRYEEIRRIVVGGGFGQGIKYTFNGLNALKPDMITEATRNARSSADRFAADSGSQVGSIRSASQGVFSISAADSVSTGRDRKSVV